MIRSIEVIIGVVGKSGKRSATYTGHSQGRLSQIGTKITIHAGRGAGPLSSSLIAQMTQTVTSLCMLNILSGIGHD